MVIGGGAIAVDYRKLTSTDRRGVGDQSVGPGGYVLFEATHNLYDESSPVTFPTIWLGC